MELPVFLECAREAGLIADPRYQAKFPPSDLATVSINVFSAARSQPDTVQLAGAWVMVFVGQGAWLAAYARADCQSARAAVANRRAR